MDNRLHYISHTDEDATVWTQSLADVAENERRFVVRPVVNDISELQSLLASPAVANRILHSRSRYPCLLRALVRRSSVPGIRLCFLRQLQGSRSPRSKFRQLVRSGDNSPTYVSCLNQCFRKIMDCNFYILVHFCQWQRESADTSSNINNG